jgi:hypothetical protein
MRAGLPEEEDDADCVRAGLSSVEVDEAKLWLVDPQSMFPQESPLDPAHRDGWKSRRTPVSAD